MNDRSLIEQIRRLILEETVFLRHYCGEVVDVNDPVSKGRVKVKIQSLGYDSNEIAVWCTPRDSNLVVPVVSDFVDVWFMEGDRNRAVYLGKCQEYDGMTPSNYDGQTTTQVVWEDPDDSANYIVLDKSAKTAKIHMLGMTIEHDGNTNKTTINGNLEVAV